MLCLRGGWMEVDLLENEKDTFSPSASTQCGHAAGALAVQLSWVFNKLVWNNWCKNRTF